MNIIAIDTPLFRPWMCRGEHREVLFLDSLSTRSLLLLIQPSKFPDSGSWKPAFSYFQCKFPGLTEVLPGSDPLILQGYIDSWMYPDLGPIPSSPGDFWNFPVVWFPRALTRWVSARSTSRTESERVSLVRPGAKFFQACLSEHR